MAIKSHYNIAIPADGKGYTHRLCPNCSTKFGIRSIDKDFPDTIYCPYCDKSGALPDYNVPEQFDYATQEGLRQIKYDVMKELQTSMSRALRGSKNFKFKPATIRYEQAPTLIQSEIPTDMMCSSCEGLYEIYGIASRCPFCSTEDIKIIDANLALIEKELDTDRGLRLIYNDVVIAFQNLCSFYALDDKKANFQNINVSQKYFKDNFNVKILDGLDSQNLQDMRVVFEKRHVEQHNSGIIDAKYTANLGLDSSSHGQRVAYSKDELQSALKALINVSNNFRTKIKL